MNEWYVDRSVCRMPGKRHRHVHETFEIYYLVKGHSTYVIADEIYNVKAGDVVLIPRNVIHNTVYGDVEYERLLINFPKSAVSFPALLSCFDGRKISLSAELSAEFIYLFNKMKCEYDSQDSYSSLIINQLLNEMLVGFCRLGTGKTASELDGYAEIMRSAVKYINASYSHQVTLCEVANEVGLSRSFFSKKFREVTGFGFNEYLTLVRVTNAKKILSEGKLGVTDTAYQCGFNDSSYFAAVFKKHVGVTPQRYSAEKKRK